MKAFLLAAGLGSRLRPLTDTVPKCLVPIAGRPLLAYWLALLERHGFTEAGINVHHLPDAVRDYVRTHPSRVRVTVFDEPQLLGSAGTIRANRGWADDGEPFLVAYADNLTGADLGALMAVHRMHRPVLTAALFRAAEPSRCGIVDMQDGVIIGFEEKPRHPKSDLANAGLYVTDTGIVDYIPDVVPADFGNHVLPHLTGRMRGHVLAEPLIDVGTWESYRLAQEEVVRMKLVDLFASETETA